MPERLHLTLVAYYKSRFFKAVKQNTVNVTLLSEAASLPSAKAACPYTFTHHLEEHYLVELRPLDD